MTLHVRYTQLEDFVSDVSKHLQDAWAEHVPLVVTVHDDAPQVVVDTIADLEALHVLIGQPRPRPDAPRHAQGRDREGAH